MVEGTYGFRRKCAREQVPTTPVLSAIYDTQVIRQSGTADKPPLMFSKAEFFCFAERTLCMKKYVKKDMFDILADVLTSEPVKIAKQCYKGSKAAKYINNIKETVSEDVRTVKERDPAASSTAEVLLLYSGLHAVWAHRISHKLYKNDHKFAARLISQGAKAITGIEIHPGATIGKNLFIDHGSGVVIGETTEIGDNCTLYQGVTLGGTGKDTGKRHPTLGDNVMVGAGARVLGPFKVGDGSKIAANAVVLNEVPENCTAVGIPAKVVKRNNKRVADDLDHIHIPDPVAQEIARLEARINELEGKTK